MDSRSDDNTVWRHRLPAFFVLPIQCVETVRSRSFTGVRASPCAADAAAGMRAEYVGCAESGLFCVLRKDEVVHFAAAKSDAIDFGNAGESAAHRHDGTVPLGSIARHSDGASLFPAPGGARAGPLTTAARGSLHVSHLIQGR